MPIQTQLDNGSLIGGGGAAFMGANVHLKPVDHGALGHYRTSAKITLLAGQVVNGRLFEIRNAGSNLLVPLLVEVSVLPFGSVVNPYDLEIGLFKCTSFSAVDTTQTTTPSVSTMRTSGMSAAPGGAHVRALSGATGGMTGWTATKDGSPISSMMAWMASVSATSLPVTKRLLDSSQQAVHPLVLAANEGFVLENLVLGSSTTNNVRVVVDVAWAEVTAY